MTLDIGFDEIPATPTTVGLRLQAVEARTDRYGRLPYQSDCRRMSASAAIADMFASRQQSSHEIAIADCRLATLGACLVAKRTDRSRSLLPDYRRSP